MVSEEVDLFKVNEEKLALAKKDVEDRKLGIKLPEEIPKKEIPKSKEKKEEPNKKKR